MDAQLRTFGADVSYPSTLDSSTKFAVCVAAVRGTMQRPVL